MASIRSSQRWEERQHPGNGARILLVNKDPRDLSYYATILKGAGCLVRATSSFAEGAQHVEREVHDLILLDQGSGGFEGRKVLATAMEVDPELRVLVLARSHDSACCLEAMQSGALDYLEGHLSGAEIVALLETFIPRRTSADVASRGLANGARPSKKSTGKTESNHVQLKTGGGHVECTKSLDSAFRPRQSGSDSSDSCNVRC
jgi:DNA-binding NtrC family response regulator